MTSRTWTSILAALGAVLFLQPPSWAQDAAGLEAALGGSASDLVFTPVVPCRIVDTRVEGGRLTAGTARDFDVAGNLGGQGGAPNCLVPDGPAKAVVVNLVAVAPLGAGNLRAWAFGAGAPTASVINYGTGVNIANGILVAICDQDAGACARDLSVRADGGDTHLVADVMGYFSPPPDGAPVSWASVTDKPAGFADDVDDDTQYSPGMGLSLAGTTFSVDTGAIQSRVAGICGPGSSIRVIDASGNVTCEPDNDTTYAGGTGIIISGSTISPDFAQVQRRVVQACAAGSSIRIIDASGNVTCEPDNDTGDITSVTAGTGLSGGGTAGAVTLAVNTTAIQARVNGTCDSAIAGINPNGSVTCGPQMQSGRALTVPLCNAELTVTFDEPFALTPSVVVSPQGLAGTALPPNTYCVVDEVTTSSFSFCCFGHEPETVSWIAMRQ